MQITQGTSNLNRLIDHTLLKAETSKRDIEKLCQEAIQYQFFSVCIPPRWVFMASQFLHNHPTQVCTVVGFPLGHSHTDIKLAETEQALADGANEIDMVMAIGSALQEDWKYVHQEIAKVKMVCKKNILKVIIETALLSDQQIIKASETCLQSGADYVKTSTGFSTRGASPQDIRLMKSVVGNKIGIKASGGIKSLDQAMDLIALGATRIGTSSGIALVTNGSPKDLDTY